MGSLSPLPGAEQVPPAARQLSSIFQAKAVCLMSAVISGESVRGVQLGRSYTAREGQALGWRGWGR